MQFNQARHTPGWPMASSSWRSAPAGRCQSYWPKAWICSKSVTVKSSILVSYDSCKCERCGFG